MPTPRQAWQILSVRDMTKTKKIFLSISVLILTLTIMAFIISQIVIQGKINDINKRLDWRSTRLSNLEGTGKGLTMNYVELHQIYSFAILPKIKINVKKALRRTLEMKIEILKTNDYEDKYFNNKTKLELINKMQNEIKELRL